MDHHLDTAVVIDAGSDRTKAGFAGDDAPRAVLPTVVGSLRDPEPGPSTDVVYAGDEAFCRRRQLRLRFPVEHGIVTDWDAMEKVSRSRACCGTALSAMAVVATRFDK